MREIKCICLTRVSTHLRFARCDTCGAKRNDSYSSILFMEANQHIRELRPDDIMLNSQSYEADLLACSSPSTTFQSRMIPMPDNIHHESGENTRYTRSLAMLIFCYCCHCRCRYWYCADRFRRMPNVMKFIATGLLTQ